MQRRIGAHRTGKLAAIAAAEKERPFVRGEQKLRDRDRRRRFAGAADGEIAETDDRRTPAELPGRLQAHACHGAIEGGKKGIRKLPLPDRHQKSGSTSMTPAARGEAA